MPKPSILSLLEQNVPALLFDMRRRACLSSPLLDSSSHPLPTAAASSPSDTSYNRTHMVEQAMEIDTDLHDKLLEVGRADNVRYLPPFARGLCCSA